jgi:hypothetical protein
MEVVCANLGHVSIGIYERKSEWDDIYQLWSIFKIAPKNSPLKLVSGVTPKNMRINFSLLL